MVSAGGLSSLLAIQSTTTASSLLFFPHKTHLNQFASNLKNPSSALSLFAVIPPNGLCFSTHLAFSSVYGRKRTGSRLFASKKKQGKRGVELLDVEGFDDELMGDDDIDIDINDEEEEDDDGSILLPLEKMNKWLENKPRGFGVEKVYDTSLEDKLLEELEQGRLAQAANLNKLRKDTPNPDLKKDEQKKKANEIPPNGVRVRVSNLPKKKNAHRDLSSAFKGVPGLICINAMVSGNKKTRDPICKGFAFVDFKSEGDATRFVQIFSRQHVSFGKIQKQIKCEIINSKTSDFALEQSAGNTHGVPPLKVKAESLGKVQIADSDTDTDGSSPEEWEKSSSVEHDEDAGDEVLMAELEDGMENLNLVDVVEINSSDRLEERTESDDTKDDNSVSSEVETIRALEKKLLAKLGKEGKAPKKKLAAKAKGEKASKKKQVVKTKEAIPGSAKRLKLREKAVLTDVLSKYAQKYSIDSKEESLVSGL
ncbi:uncharacterized protein LOC133822043 [Humulus lupulus]|uniref:uncharacterized protein LOC133822043 n=1 Tax=Humulus lupulus TaxID=3486 RepID=UPI002B410E01|nr:uncharacterized protein LOC133822043 [Humulus lupulus]